MERAGIQERMIIKVNLGKTKMMVSGLEGEIPKQLL